MMKQLLTLTLFFIFTQLSYAQSEKVYIKGKIVSSNLPVKNVNILNITTKQGTISDAVGEFEITVRENDTLKFSHLEYQTKKIIITRKFLKLGSITIELKEMTNYLSTVTIRNHDLTGDLVLDTKNNTNDTITRKHDLIEEMMRMAKMPSSKDFDTNFEKPPLNDVDPVSAVAGAAIGSVGIPIIDKENVLRKKLRAKKSFPNKLISEFGEDFFTKELKIPKEKIHHFITYCEIKNIQELYKQGKIIKLIEVLTEESKIYIN